MKIAIPLTGGKLSAHFGHCERFAIIDADQSSGAILARQEVVPPPHEPGSYPAWLAERGATHIISGGMGQQASRLRTFLRGAIYRSSSERPPLIRRTSQKCTCVASSGRATMPAITSMK